MAPPPKTNGGVAGSETLQKETYTWKVGYGWNMADG